MKLPEDRTVKVVIKGIPTDVFNEELKSELESESPTHQMFWTTQQTNADMACHFGSRRARQNHLRHH